MFGFIPECFDSIVAGPERFRWTPKVKTDTCFSDLFCIFLFAFMVFDVITAL